MATGDLRAVPVNELDANVTELIIHGPRNNIIIGAIFNSMKKLRVLRITDSNVPAIGQHSFWGVTSLRILGALSVDEDFCCVIICSLVWNEHTKTRELHIDIRISE